MPYSIPLTGLAATDIVPGNYVEIQFAQGAVSSGSTVYSVLLVGNRSTAGDATVDTVVYGPDTSVPVQNEADVIARFGTGSELHRMWRRFTAVNRDTPVYMLAVTESAGVAASGTITFTTTATGSAVARVFCGDDYCDATIASGDTVTTIASAVATAINAKTEWPVTASPAVGVVTLTAKCKGPRGNSIRISGAIIATSSVGTTVAPTAHTALTSGATLDTWTTALSTVLPNRYYYIVPACADATTCGTWQSQIASQALPTSNIRQRLIVGSVDTLANATTFATGLNGARTEVAWMQNADLTEAELAASVAALYSLGEASTNPQVNFNGVGNGANDAAIWKIAPPRSGTAPTRTSIKSALNNGLTPIAVNGTRNTYLVKRITARSLNGSTADYRVRDGHKVSICDFFADDLQAKFSLQFAGKKIGNDVASAASRPNAPDVVTPNIVKAAAVKLVREYAEDGKLQNPDAIIADMVVTREAAPSTRIGLRIPLQTIDILDQTATRIDQTA